MASGAGTGVWARVGSAISGLFFGGDYFLGSRHTGRRVTQFVFEGAAVLPFLYPYEDNDRTS